EDKNPKDVVREFEVALPEVSAKSAPGLAPGHERQATKPASALKGQAGVRKPVRDDKVEAKKSAPSAAAATSRDSAHAAKAAKADNSKPQLRSTPASASSK